MKRSQGHQTWPERRLQAAVTIGVSLALGVALWAFPHQAPAAHGAQPGARVVLDAHNAYPYNGRFVDRIDRALATGLPVAIEQDLVWRPASDGLTGRSVVSHGAPFDGTEPGLREHFFERIRPVVERALADGDTTRWPLITLNLDLKTNEPEHHQALWQLLGEYQAWLTTAQRTADATTVAPLDVKPLLVLTGESDAQAHAFHDDVAVGARLRLFGAMPVRPDPATRAPTADEQDRLWRTLPDGPLPSATNYRRWWNAPWAVVEKGGQRQAGEWTAEEASRLRTLVRRAHDAGMWMRLWTVNGHPVGGEKSGGWSPGYNVGSLEAARTRWRAAAAAGVDFIATDQYEDFVAVLSSGASPAAGAREIVLEGTLASSDRLTWLERPFEVPPGTSRIDVTFSYTDRQNGTAVEVGLFDPLRLRGASRTSKDGFFVSRTAATPSYQPGEIQAGTWRLLLGVPSIRDGASSRYRAIVRLTQDGPVQPTPLAVPASRAQDGPRWYQGDLHAHTMHSDGFSCADGRGEAGPCSAHQVAEAAERRGLDFAALTDHNTTSHHHGMTEVQARHPHLLLLRGQEVTTFYGHANVFGTSEIVDFRIGHPGVTANGVFRSVARLGALASINHPGRETGERCTGCGWTAPGTDFGLVDAMEVVNGRTVSGPTAGEAFWHARLNEGHRLTGIGGGDDHGAATRQGSAVGTPTTVIHAEALTEAALLAAIRAGRVYIKTRGPEGPDVRFSAPSVRASMGDVVQLTAGPVTVDFRATLMRARGQSVEVIMNGRVRDGLLPQPLASNDETSTFQLTVSPGDWVRLNLRDGAGTTVMTNPIYFR